MWGVEAGLSEALILPVVAEADEGLLPVVVVLLVVFCMLLVVLYTLVFSSVSLFIQVLCNVRLIIPVELELYNLLFESRFDGV